MNYKVCVLLASFNGEEFIEDQILSILNQSSCSISLYIRDDSSNDGTPLVLEFLQRKFSDKIVLLNDDFGPTGSAGRNFLQLFKHVDLSDYEFIAFSDQDDIWQTDKIISAIDVMNSIGANGYSSNLKVWDGKKQISLLEKTSTQRSYDFLFQGASAGCTYLLGRFGALLFQKYCRIVDFDSTYGFLSHDWVIYTFFRVNNLPWVHDHNSYILYRQHSSNVYGASKLFSLSKVKMILNKEYLEGVITAFYISRNDTSCSRIREIVFSSSFLVRMKIIFYFRELRREFSASVALSILILFGYFSRKPEVKNFRKNFIL